MDCSTCKFRRDAIYRGADVALIRAIQDIRTGSAAFSKGQLIMADQRESRHVYTLTRGWAFSYALLRDGRRQILDYYTAGDFLTLSTLMENGIKASVRALTDVEACCFDAPAIRTLLASKERLVPGVFSYFGEKKAQCDARITSLGALKAEEAVAVLILSLVHRSAPEPGSNMQHLFPLRLADIADAVGITDIHAGRIIRRLEKQGAIERQGSDGFLVNIATLRQVTEEVAPVVFEI